MGFTKPCKYVIIEKVFEIGYIKGGKKMYYFKEFFENSNEYDYEQLPNIMQDDFLVQRLI